MIILFTSYSIKITISQEIEHQSRLQTIPVGREYHVAAIFLSFMSHVIRIFVAEYRTSL